ncbi:MAG: hypothetical protein ACPGQL_06535 [Thermoplasmatota archaeon]
MSATALALVGLLLAPAAAAGPGPVPVPDSQLDCYFGYDAYSCRTAGQEFSGGNDAVNQAGRAASAALIAAFDALGLCEVYDNGKTCGDDGALLGLKIKAWCKSVKTEHPDGTVVRERDYGIKIGKAAADIGTPPIGSGPLGALEVDSARSLLDRL